MTSNRAWQIAGGAVLLVVTFAMGYVVGSRPAAQKGVVEAGNTLSSQDMEHAFGSIKHAAQEPAAQSLGSLVTGLEKKVAANPENIEQQLLLAQTYNELGHREKGLGILRALNKQASRNAQVKITLATILMKSVDKQDLIESAQLFEEAIKLQPDVASMAKMYQGEVRVKLDNMSKQPK